MTDEQETPRGTLYRVYSSSDSSGNALVFVGEATALNDIKAIKSVVGDGVPPHYHYVGIPASRFRVRKAQDETVVKVTIS